MTDNKFLDLFFYKTIKFPGSKYSFLVSIYPKQNANAKYQSLIGIPFESTTNQ
jgi:hypothetical protein